MPLEGLPPVAEPDARTLVLGSMPGARSLAEGRYYVGPGNRFWKVMATVFGFDAGAEYETRVRSLLDRRVALWDVLASCERDGSLDTRIVRASEVPNDLAGFLDAHASIGLIVLNGSRAAGVFARVASDALRDRPAVRVAALPSTSGANARLRLHDLVERWSDVLETH